MKESNVAPSELYIVPPLHRSGDWTAFIQTVMLFWSPVSHQPVKFAGYAFAPVKNTVTGTTIGEPAASGPFAPPQCTGTLMFAKNQTFVAVEFEPWMLKW